MLVWQLILIQVVTFALIILFLRWLLYTHIGRALRRLQQLNQQNLEKEKVLKEELERARRQAEGEIERGKQEAASIKERAKEEAEKEARRMLEISRREAKRIVNEAERDSQRKYKDLVLKMQDKAVYLAMDIIGYLFSQGSQENLQIQLVDELIKEAEELEEQKMEAIGNNAEIISAFPLQDTQKKRLKEILSSKLKKDITLTEKIDQDIVAGLVIKLGGFVIDGSIKNKFKKILPLMKEKAKDT